MFGASFSIKYARDMGLEPKACLEAALSDLGLRRLRLMSYWDVHERARGKYDFTELDWQLDMAEAHGAEVTLCLGLRQPRWPESHWPHWAKVLPDAEWKSALYDYITAVIHRYKDRQCITSYQLENEALLKTFGADGNFDRTRLKHEFRLVKQLDPSRPVIMTTSNSWGIPFFGPVPDMFGFSIYRYFYDKGHYRHASRPPLFYQIRAIIIKLIKWSKTFIHELQAEPWGPQQTYDMSLEEQYKSMNHERVREAVEFAQKTGLTPIDIWGLEWWYYLKTQHKQPDVWDYIRTIFQE